MFYSNILRSYWLYCFCWHIQFLKSDCTLLQTDLVGEAELGSVVQRIKVGLTSSSYSFISLDDYMLVSQTILGYNVNVFAMVIYRQ